MAIGKEIYELLRTHGGFSGDFQDIIESDFAASSGPAYSPPEISNFNFRRIVAARQIQLLAECPVVLKTFQTSAATLRLPANTVADSTNDSGDGRLFILTNAGTGSITIQDYLGAALYTLAVSSAVIIAGNNNNVWDFLATGGTGGGGGAALTWGRSGTIPPSTWLLNDTTPSNKTGREVGLTGCSVVKVCVSNLDAAIIKVGVYYHSGDGLGMTLLGTVTTAAQRSNDFTVSWAVPQGRQLATRIETDSPNAAKEPVVGLHLLGTI